jgi:uroporphyrinogen decarboxylase
MTLAKEMGGEKGGWIANLGHGITPGVRPEDLKVFLERMKIEGAKKSADELEK